MKKSAPTKVRSQGKSIDVPLELPLRERLRQELHGVVVSLGIQGIIAMLEEERAALCGPRYAHDPEREAHRAGSAPASMPLGGRLVQVRRPRVVDREGREIPLATWTDLRSTDPLDRRVLEQMTLGVATRKYARSLEPLPEELSPSGASKSAVSRRFVELTKQKLEEWLARPLDPCAIRVVFIDGIHIDEHVVLVALGVDDTGKKQVLSMREGATENSVVCKKMLRELVERGLDPATKRLFVIDGSGARAKAIRDTFGDRALVQRCQVHKVRNVLAHLPAKKHARARSIMRQAYASAKPETAKRQLVNFAESLKALHPSAATSIREGLDETLTVKGLGLDDSLERTLSTTNPIENINERIRRVTGRVKRWRGGAMVLRWTLAGVLEAERGFRRVKGCSGMPKLIAALDGPAASTTKTDLDGAKKAA